MTKDQNGEAPPAISPKWSTTLKLVMAISLVAVLFGLLIKFQSLLPQLFLIIMVAYLVNPIADRVVRNTRIPWKFSVTVVYLLIVVIVFIVLTFSGVTILQQIQNLVTVVSDSVEKLPALLKQAATKPLQIGPFSYDLTGIDTDAINRQIMNSAQPLLSATGSVLTTLASGAVNFMGWTLFVLLGSYFILIQNDDLWQGIFNINLPGYEDDLKRMGNSLSKIWNSFLRGQMIVMAISGLVYAIVLGGLGVSYAIAIAIFAGLARFVPYVGPLILWIILALTSYFQDYKLADMEPWSYALLVVAIAFLIDAIMDNIVMPRILASSLEVHPAVIMVAAILGLDLLGILGVILAAPLVASVQFFLRYIFRKMFDMDPWDGYIEQPPTPRLRDQIKAMVQKYLPLKRVSK